MVKTSSLAESLQHQTQQGVGLLLGVQLVDTLLRDQLRRHPSVALATGGEETALQFRTPVCASLNHCLSLSLSPGV